MRDLLSRVATAHVALALSLVAGGCGIGGRLGAGTPADLATGFVFGDDGGATDAAPTGPTACDDVDPACQSASFGPTNGMAFPLQSDPQKAPGEADQGLGRDPTGALQLDQTHGSFNYLWISNTDDWGRGTVSKIDSKTVTETARYFTTTCFSNPTGSRASCDGMNGCCAGDDYPRYQARIANQKQPARETIQTMSNYPSRTAVDFNGDVFVANRAFGGQSSVTHIANDPSECKDRNKDGKIETSSDANGDGLIQTDCNGNGTPDDLVDVKATPCLNGAKQEFFGDDDECILWTTNTDVNNQWGRPLALGPGAVDFGPSDAWAGCYNDGKFFRIDGTTGQTKADAQGPVNAYGAAVDAKNIIWVAVLSSGIIGIIDATNPKNVANTRSATFSLNAYGIAIDRDQNVWQGGWTNQHAYRYTPDRTNGFASLKNGYWTVITTPGAAAGASGNGRGIAADSRSAGAYFVWMARDGGWVSRIDASKIPVPKGMDVMIDGSAYPAFHVDGTQTIGAGVDVDQNVWGISNSGSVATRAKIDMNGNITAPDITSPAANGKKCPAGDRCPLTDNNHSSPDPYTYSDFTGFGLRNFTNPRGTYSVVVPGCQSSGSGADTQWYAVNWDATVPPNTTLAVHVRSGNTPTPDATWGQWTTTFLTSPADLRTNVPLIPNDKDDAYLQVEFIFSTQAKDATPKLQDFTVGFKCGQIG